MTTMLLVATAEDPTTVPPISSNDNVPNVDVTIVAEVATIAASDPGDLPAIEGASRSAQVRRLQMLLNDAQVVQNVLLKAVRVLLAQ